MEDKPIRRRYSTLLHSVVACVAIVVLAISATHFSYAAGDAPVPLLEKGHPVDWWFVFKFNTASFPACSAGAEQSCPFGGEVQTGKKVGQQFVYASSENHALTKGSDCLGDTTEDPVGATYDEVYNGSFFYVVWNDQFYNDPPITGEECHETYCGGPWGHSKGMLAWNDDGDGFVMQVTTPSWPASGSSHSPRQHDGNSLGCIADNNILVSQHFFALKLTKDDLVKVLKALANASVVTDIHNRQVVNNGGPPDVRNLVETLGAISGSQNVLVEKLSSGVELISKPSNLNVPPWQMVSAELGRVDLRVATWWQQSKIYSTTRSTRIGCWDDALGRAGAVAIATSGQFDGTDFGLKGGANVNGNHAKIGVSTSEGGHFSIFGDMNQEGTLSGDDCTVKQNGRGGIFYVIDDAALAEAVADLTRGETAPRRPPPP